MRADALWWFEKIQFKNHGCKIKREKVRVKGGDPRH